MTSLLRSLRVYLFQYKSILKRRDGTFHKHKITTVYAYHLRERWTLQVSCKKLFAVLFAKRAAKDLRAVYILQRDGEISLWDNSQNSPCLLSFDGSKKRRNKNTPVLLSFYIENHAELATQFGRVRIEMPRTCEYDEQNADPVTWWIHR